MSASQTIAMSIKARELKEQGKDVINLSLGEPDFDIPTFVKDEAKKAIDDNFSKYTPVPGYMDLRKAIAEKLKRDNNLDYSPSQIVVSTGAKQSIINALMALINPGDEVIIPAPYWVSYIEMVKLVDGIPLVIPTSTDSDFKITAQQLESVITQKTKAFIFSSPCNPSGSVYSREELKSLAEVFARHKNVFIISDEIYEYINFSAKHESIAQFEELYNRVITINGLSKSFAMTGWRIGYLAASESIAKACDKIQSQTTSGTCSIAQRAAILAVKATPSSIGYMRDAFLSRRDLVIRELSKIDGFKLNNPQGAFYIFPDISHFFGRELKGRTISNADDFSMFLLEQANVATVSGNAFGSPNCIRISYATSEEQLIKAIEKIRQALS
ncbi:aspartate aminotransferase [Ichthyobacterium seriolicida]|uniref:Aminotransferase n=2 Tax=Ichthyobacterium seriolicida TaxID=242600 RepID=A0A1J1DXA8_9FLAO|nr:aspartate aminotransferase [Ichthyobacterium seriolicida]